VAITLEQSEAGCCVRLEGEIDIGCAGELKKILIQALESGNAVQVGLEGAAGLDVTAMQLLWAADREARKRGGGLAMRGPMPEQIARAVAEAGWEEFPVTVREEPRPAK
jgi:anti-anti-sigma factor